MAHATHCPSTLRTLARSIGAACLTLSLSTAGGSLAMADAGLDCPSTDRVTLRLPNEDDILLIETTQFIGGQSEVYIGSASDGTWVELVVEFDNSEQSLVLVFTTPNGTEEVALLPNVDTTDGVADGTASIWIEVDTEYLVERYDGSANSLDVLYFQHPAIFSPQHLPNDGTLPVSKAVIKPVRDCP